VRGRKGEFSKRRVGRRTLARCENDRDHPPFVHFEHPFPAEGDFEEVPDGAFSGHHP
jgi:hypothetical protein